MQTQKRIIKMFSLLTPRDRLDLLDDLILTGGLEDQTADCLGNAISVTDLVQLLVTLWTTRVIEDSNLRKAREETKIKAKDEAEAKAIKAEVVEEAEEEHHLATLAIPTAGILIAHRNLLLKITNLHLHHAMMGYVGIVTSLDTRDGIVQNW